MRGGWSRLRLTGADLLRLVVSWLTTALALHVAALILPGMSTTAPLAYLVVAAVAGLIGLVVRPVLVELAARIGWLAVLVVAVAGQAMIMYAAILLVPAMTADFWAPCWRAGSPPPWPPSSPGRPRQAPTRVWSRP